MGFSFVNHPAIFQGTATWIVSAAAKKTWKMVGRWLAQQISRSIAMAGQLHWLTSASANGGMGHLGCGEHRNASAWCELSCKDEHSHSKETQMLSFVAPVGGISQAPGCRHVAVKPIQAHKRIWMIPNKTSTSCHPGESNLPIDNSSCLKYLPHKMRKYTNQQNLPGRFNCYDYNHFQHLSVTPRPGVLFQPPYVTQRTEPGWPRRISGLCFQHVSSPSTSCCVVAVNQPKDSEMFCDCDSLRSINQNEWLTDYLRLSSKQIWRGRCTNYHWKVFLSGRILEKLTQNDSDLLRQTLYSKYVGI